MTTCATFPTFLCLRPMVSGPLLPICYTDPNFGGVPCTGAPDTWPGYAAPALLRPSWPASRLWLTKSTDARAIQSTITRLQTRSTDGKGAQPAFQQRHTVGSGCVFHDVTLGDMDVNCTATQIQSGHKTVTASFNCYLDGATNGVLSTSNYITNRHMRRNRLGLCTGIGTVNAITWCSAPGGGRPVFRLKCEAARRSDSPRRFSLCE